MQWKGKKITLTPAMPKDRRLIFQWMAESDITSHMMGPPLFPEIEIPTWEEFDDDYEEFMFGETLTHQGHCMIIQVNGEQIGQVNYGEVNLAEKQVELDIWLAAKKHTGKGYGTDALLTLCQLLNEIFGCTSFIIAPSARNPFAVKSYQKAGFKITKEVPTNFKPDYHDTVIMKKNSSMS